VPPKYQHRVLFWGVLGALVMRVIMILAGSELINHFHWVIYIFGAFLIYTGIKMFAQKETDIDPENRVLVKAVTRYIPIARHYERRKFFTVIDGKRVGTLLLLVLIVVEFTDLIFALDSIPAIFGVTTDRFIVYTSNVFAILGLRTFYFLLTGVVEKFHYLKFGLGIVLSFIGVKMLLPFGVKILSMIFGSSAGSLARFQDIPTGVALGIVALVLLASVAASFIWPKRRLEENAKQDFPP
jgi:tellurite resistance protein TerC